MRRRHGRPCIWGSAGCDSFCKLWRVNARGCVGTVVDLYGSWRFLELLYRFLPFLFGRFCDVCGASGEYYNWKPWRRLVDFGRHFGPHRILNGQSACYSKGFRRSRKKKNKHVLFATIPLKLESANIAPERNKTEVQSTRRFSRLLLSSI